MINDANELPSDLELTTGICIVGAGAAGITIANELTHSRIGVTVLEGGNLTYTADSQSLYEADNIGQPYYGLAATRLRFFGGTTNHYAGDFAPLDVLDYEKRPGLPETGWPITPQDMAPYYRRAHEYCHLGPMEYGGNYWADVTGGKQLPFDPNLFRTRVRQSTPTRFATAYRDSLEKADNVSIFLNANVVDIILDENSDNVRHVVATNFNGARINVSAKLFVIAAGGLENPRILLNANSQRSEGIGNENDLVGRYFMEHIGVRAGLISIADDRWNKEFYSTHEVDVARAVSDPQNPLSIQPFLCPTEDVVRSNGLANLRMSFFHFGSQSRANAGRQSGRFFLDDLARFSKRKDSRSDLERALRNLDSIAGLGRNPGQLGSIFKPFTVIEQLPNPNSRVKLVGEEDRFGLRKLALDWQWTAEDKRSVLYFQKLVATELGRTGIGRMKLELDERDAVSFGLLFHKSDRFGNSLRAGNHHIGTTRMSDNPSRGVTDSTCRVHATQNLYVAGSSVFPTAGLWNPTLTIVALALRLSDELRRRVT